MRAAAVALASLVGSAALAAAGCSAGPPPGPGPPRPSQSTTATPPGGSAGPSASATPRVAVVCPPPRGAPSAAVLARPPFAPDDLAATGDGGLWATDPVAGVVALLDARTGAVRMSFRDPASPEGVVPLGDGRIALAEQARNRVVVLRPPDPTPTVLVDIGPAPPTLGVDGIALDAAGSGLLVPDSHGGRLLDVPLDGSAPRVLSSGLGRPVDAAPLQDGSVVVAVEGDHGLLRVPAAGAGVAALGGVAQGDDVVASGGVVYVSSLSAGTVTAVDPATGAEHVLLTGLGQPQGLAHLDGARFAVADPQGRVIRVFDGCA